MTLDNMGSKERAWLCAGNGWFVDVDAERSELWLASGQRPVLALCRDDAADRDVREYTFGWAFAELCERRFGWLEMYRQLLRLVEAVAAVAASLLIVCDATGNGLPDLVELAAHLARLAMG